jgi:preprotein translocase subunit Sss1
MPLAAIVSLATLAVIVLVGIAGYLIDKSIS